MTGLPLLDPSFVSKLEALRRRLEIRARSGGAGERLAKRRGGSSEFHEHKPYTAGDDLRRMDWAAYARSGQPVLKVYRAEEDVIMRLLVDASTSLSVGVPQKLATAQRLAAALGYLALSNSERTQLAVAAGAALKLHPPNRSRAGLLAWLRLLNGIECRGDTQLRQAIDKLVLRSRRPGMLVIVSDFFDSGPYLQGLNRAAAAGHDVLLVQVVSPDEEDPSHEGDWMLEDVENGSLVELTMDRAALEAYRKRFEGLCGTLRQWARRHRASYVRVRSNEALEPAVRRLVARAID